MSLFICYNIQNSFLWYELRIWGVTVIVNICIFIPWHQLKNLTKRVCNNSYLSFYLAHIIQHDVAQKSECISCGRILTYRSGANKAEVAPSVLKIHFMVCLHCLRKRLSCKKLELYQKRIFPNTRLLPGVILLAALLDKKILMKQYTLKIVKLLWVLEENLKAMSLSNVLIHSRVIKLFQYFEADCTEIVLSLHGSLGWQYWCFLGEPTPDFHLCKDSIKQRFPFSEPVWKVQRHTFFFFSF